MDGIATCGSHLYGIHSCGLPRNHSGLHKCQSSDGSDACGRRWENGDALQPERDLLARLERCQKDPFSQVFELSIEDACEVLEPLLRSAIKERG